MIFGKNSPMLKRLGSLIFLITILIASQLADARIMRKKKKNKSSTHSISRLGKHSKHVRKSRYYHRGTGPDLKSITIESPYKEDPKNGVNPIEGSK